MQITSNKSHASAMQLLQSLPGMGDVVWGTVMRLSGKRVPTSVLFTAAERGAGTTVLAAATAIGLAQHQRVPVCLIETNVRRPALARYLGLKEQGLSDVLDGRAELDECLQETDLCPGLFLLPAGSARAAVSGEFTTERMTSLLARLEKRVHYLVIDTAPLLDHVESRILLNHADGVLLVLRERATRLADAERAYEILVDSGAPVLGSIFNAHRGSARFCGNGPVRHPFEKDLRVARRVTSPAPVAAPRGTNGHTNGVHDLEAHEPGTNGSEATQQHQIAQLERRLAKLTLQLAQTESDLQRLAALKEIDPGIASLYRGAQGLAAEDQAKAHKRALMQDIFQANLDLKTAMAGRP